MFLNDAQQPLLVVNYLKLGENAPGGVGLWVDNGTVVESHRLVPFSEESLESAKHYFF